MSAGVISGIPIESVRPEPAAVALPVALPLAVRGDRLALLDGVRLMAAVGIVWVHAAGSDAGKLLWPLGTFGVPFYTYAAVLFMARSLTKPDARSLGAYAVSRATRIYLPFLFWSFVYVMLGEAKSIVRDHTMNLPTPAVLYEGGQQHLWFLPFLMVVTLVGATLVRGVQRFPALRTPTIAILVALGVLAAVAPEPAWVARRVDDVEVWRYGLRALPTVFWALALALATTFHGRLPRTTVRTAVLGATLLIGTMLLQEEMPTVKALRSFAGLGCVAIALLPLASPVVARLGRLGRYSYGIYLSHVLFLRLVAMWNEAHGHVPSLASDAAAFAFAFTAAAGLSVLFSRSKWTRWTLGE